MTAHVGPPLFGAAYYPEYAPERAIDVDLDLMVAAGFSVIRVGESVWSTWEPRDGEFDVKWLTPVLDGAAERGIGVLLGTPTYAIPPWLRRAHPELALEIATGEPVPYGGRQDVDYSHPTFRAYAERLVRAILAQHAQHPAVVGFQVDNEPGWRLIHNDGAFESFVAHLQVMYGSVDRLNEAWGLTYWSHRLSEWADLWRPDGNTTPSYDLAWRRFQAGLTTSFIEWQAEIVREYASAEQFVTCCLAVGRPALHPARVADGLDVIGVNLYFPMQDALARPESADGSQWGKPVWADAHGLWSLFRQLDVARAITDGPFLVTETHAATIGESHVNFPPYAGQLRQVAWAMVGRGARMVEYWQWQTLNAGHETYWGGVLGHSRTPSRVYAEVAAIGAEFAAAGSELNDLRPDADVAFVHSLDSRWAMEFTPPLPSKGSGHGGDGDPSSYDEIFDAYYRAFFNGGWQIDVVFDDRLPEVGAAVVRWPVLVLPAGYVAADAQLRWYADYAAAGGHLVLGFHPGYADREARPQPVLAPGVLREAAGVSFAEFSTIAGAVPLRSSVLSLDSSATALGWADGFDLEGADVLASYEHPHFGQWPAITTHAHGAGRVTCVGTLPDESTGAGLVKWLAVQPLVASDWQQLPPSVTVSSARGPQRRVWFCSNWAWDDAVVTAPVALVDLASGDALAAGSRLVLGAWDTRVLVERIPPRVANSFKEEGQ
ncbi:MAG: beta-galactosidase [Actinomycetota bacterium]|nr:beta-galactosidase [Actinomycetota bacterium]